MRRPIHQSNDFELAMRCAAWDEGAAGDEKAWRELMQRHGQTVFAVCFRVLGDEAEARDAAQESLVKALRAIGGFQEGRTLKPWLVKIAWNHALRKAAQRARRPVPVQMGSDESLEAVSGLPDPAQIAEERELREELLRYLEQLPEQQRVILELRWGEGMGYLEISESLGIPIGTVKTVLFRARERLIRALAQGEEDDELQRRTSLAAALG